MRLDSDARICSALNHNYLLEKSRVTSIAADERSYHIYYRLTAGCTSLTSSERARLQLAPPEHFEMLKQSGCFVVDGVDDGEMLNGTLDAMTNLGISDDEISFALDVTAAILHLGQIGFRRTRGSIGEGSAYHEGCAALSLHVAPATPPPLSSPPHPPPRAVQSSAPHLQQLTAIITASNAGAPFSTGTHCTSRRSCCTSKATHSTA